MSTTQTVVTVDNVDIKGVKIDPVKREIVVQFSMRLTADTYEASNKIAFWAFNEQQVELRIENPQRVMTQLDHRVSQEGK